VTFWFDKAPLAQQLTGLGLMLSMVTDKSVLDVGCAEGLILAECLDRGARTAYGVDIRQAAIERALENKHIALAARRSCVGLECADVNDWRPHRHYDIVLLLGVLHKLADPSAVLRRMLGCCRNVCVVRLPHDDWPVLRDSRSGDKPHNLLAVAEDCGFLMARIEAGPKVGDTPPQWTGYLERHG
jgi:SAM-dependent methyltransferase